MKVEKAIFQAREKCALPPFEKKNKLSAKDDIFVQTRFFSLLNAENTLRLYAKEGLLKYFNATKKRARSAE